MLLKLVDRFDFYGERATYAEFVRLCPLNVEHLVPNIERLVEIVILTTLQKSCITSVYRFKFH